MRGRFLFNTPLQRQARQKDFRKKGKNALLFMAHSRTLTLTCFLHHLQIDTLIPTQPPHLHYYIHTKRHTPRSSLSLPILPQHVPSFAKALRNGWRERERGWGGVGGDDTLALVDNRCTFPPARYSHNLRSHACHQEPPPHP